MYTFGSALTTGGVGGSEVGVSSTLAGMESSFFSSLSMTWPCSSWSDGTIMIGGRDPEVVFELSAFSGLLLD